MRWAYTGGQGFEGAPWNGTLTGQPPNVAVKNVDWNKVLGPGASTSFGFNATGTAPGHRPGADLHEPLIPSSTAAPAPGVRAPPDSARPP